MNTKIGTPEWIDKQLEANLDERAYKLNPDNIRSAEKPARECLNQSCVALEYGILAAGLAATIAIAGAVSWSYKKFGKKKAEEEPAGTIEEIEIVPLGRDDVTTECA